MKAYNTLSDFVRSTAEYGAIGRLVAFERRAHGCAPLRCGQRNVQILKILCIVLSVALIAAFCGVSHAGTLNVVTTTTDLRAIAQAVGGDHVKATSICEGNQDPHFIQAKPSYMMVARKADLWIRIGMELEIGWEGLILDGSRNQKIQPGQPGHLDASDGILRLEVPTGKVTREMGDVHPEGNPHYWLDPFNARIIAGTIAARLSQIDPTDAAVFGANLATFRTALDERMFGPQLVKEVGGDKLWDLETKGQLSGYLKEKNLAGQLGGWAGAMAPFRGQQIVTFHRSWSYFVNRFGLTVADEMEPKPGIPPSPGHALEIIEKVKSQKIRVLLMEPYYNRQAPDLIAGKTGVRVLVCANSVDGEPAAKDYLSMVDNVVNKVSAAFKSAPGQKEK